MRRNKLRAAAPWLIAMALIVAIGAGTAVVYLTPAFDVERVQVVSARLVSAEQVRAAAGVRPGTPLAAVAARAVSRRVVAALPPVRAVTVRRILPATLQLRVVERVPAARAEAHGGVWLIDATGVPYAPAGPDAAALPLLRTAAPGSTDPTTLAGLRVLAALPAALQDRMRTLVADGPARIRLELVDDRVVVWGDATQNDAKARAALTLLDQPGRVLDVSAPDFVTTR
jgi:cell division protein FtsQ